MKRQQCIFMTVKQVSGDQSVNLCLQKWTVIVQFDQLKWFISLFHKLLTTGETAFSIQFGWIGLSVIIPGFYIGSGEVNNERTCSDNMAW